MPPPRVVRDEVPSRIIPDHITNTERLAAQGPAAVLVTVTHGHPPVMSIYPLPEGKKLVAMQAAVNGYIEHIHIGPSAHRPFVMYDGWVNEDGVVNELPVGLQVRCVVGGQYEMLPIHGSLLITAGESLSGETVPLTVAEIRDIVFLTMRDGMLPVVAIIPEHKDA
jgi:hypothetical protein